MCGLMAAVPATAAESNLAVVSQEQVTSETIDKDITIQPPSVVASPDGTGEYDMFCSEPTPRPIANTNGCLGTVTAYISGNFAWKVNRLALLASAPSGRDSQALNKWCSSHSFDCQFASFTATVVFAVLYGILTGGSTSRVAPDATVNPGAAVGRLTV